MSRKTGDRLVGLIRAANRGRAERDFSDAELLARYAAGRDEAAFAELVRRHAGMVLGVARRVLGETHDADDVCQATFLLLARKKESIRGSIAGWLCATARLTALNARKARGRRTRAESGAIVGMPTPSPLDRMTAAELLAAMDEELSRLPDRYRGPLVLCCLEGLARDDAARRLGVPAGTLNVQLDRGRDRLRAALAKRGLELGAVLFAGIMASVASAAVPKLVESVLAAALGRMSLPVAALIRGKNAMTTKLLLIGGLVAGLASGVGGVLYDYSSTVAHAFGAQLPNEDPGSTKADARSQLPKDSAPVAAGGLVLDPDGEPVAGARVYVTRQGDKVKGDPKPCAVTGKSGRFAFTVPAADPEGRRAIAVFAVADGFGPAWKMIPAKADEYTLRLVKDDVPVKGRIVNLEGKPVSGITIEVRAVKASPDGSLTPWLEAVKSRPSADGNPLENEYLPMFAAVELTSAFPKITTGADGRFTFHGVGRERVVTLLIEGSAIETREVNVLTRPDLPTITIPPWRQAPQLWSDLTYCSVGFDHPVAPCRPVSGIVRDKATGKPLIGATIRTQNGVGNPVNIFQTTTDKAGRYRLTGLPVERPKRGQDTLIVLSPSDGPAYLSRREQIVDGDRLKEATLDFELERGIWIEGRVTDKGTGHGVESSLEYFVFSSDAPNADLNNLRYLPLSTDRQGRFRFVGMSCRALLGARAVANAEHFRIGVGADRIDGKEEAEAGIKGTRSMTFRTLPYIANAWDKDVLAEVKPVKGADKAMCDLVLDAGRKQTVRTLGPDGKPLVGVKVAGEFARRFFGKPLEGPECTVYGLADREPRTLLFVHEGKKLSGLLELKGDEKGRVDITLQSAAAVTGRLLDGEGRPLRRAEGDVYYVCESDGKRMLNNHSAKIMTDTEGRFRIEGLVPEIRYLAQIRLKGERTITVFDELSLKAGESKDLGDVKLKTPDE